jgi:hypothetical protein
MSKGLDATSDRSLKEPRGIEISGPNLVGRLVVFRGWF